MLVLLAAILLQTPTTTLTGTVRSDPEGEPIAGAAVAIPALERGATSDEHGYFVLPDLPAGEWQVMVLAGGYASWSGRVVVAQGVAARLEARLQARPIRIEGPVAAAARGAEQDAPGPAVVSIQASSLRATPSLAEPDVLRTVQSLPSVAAVSDFSSALYVRGGSPDQTLVTLDGIPVFNPYHVAGIFSAFDPDAIAGVEVRAGALPAEVGDRLSGLVAVRTRDGGRDALHSSGAVSLMSMRLGLDGPLPAGRGSFRVSGRRSYVDLLSEAASRLGLGSGEFPYALSDLHAKLTYDVGSGGRLTASAYANGEGFRVPRSWDVGDVRWRWGSRNAGIEYRQPIAGTLLLQARASLSHFGGRLDPLSGAGEPIARTRQEDRVVGVALARYGREHLTSVGFQMDAYRLAHRVVSSGPGRLADFLPAMDREDTPITLALHLSDAWTVAPRFRVEAGARLLAAEGIRPVWMPRVGARYRLGERLDLTLGAGRYAQLVQTVRDEESVVASVFAYDLLGGAEAGQPERADDVVLGLEWSTGSSELRVEGYAKRYGRLQLAPLAADPGSSPALVAGGFEEGRGSARGLELFAQRTGTRASFTAAYSWALSRRTVGETEFTPRFNQAHALDASTTLALGPRVTALARLIASSGQPYTPVAGIHGAFHFDPETGRYASEGTTALYAAHNGARLPGYLRLDIGIRGRLEREWFGRTGTLTPYLGILNLLHRRNVLWATAHANPSRVEWEYAPQLPILPTVGIEWRF